MLRRWGPLAGLVLLGLIALFFLGHDKDWGPINWAFGRKIPHEIRVTLFVAVVLAALPLVYLLARSAAPAALRLGSVVVLGCGLYWGYTLAEGRGQGAMYDLVWLTGHHDFIDIARGQNLDGLAARYDEYVQTRSWRFPRSKPPGLLMVYQGVVALARTPVGGALAAAFHQPDDDKGRITAVMYGLLPVLNFLIVFPLFWLARELASRRAADVTVLLYLVAPSVSIVTMYFDGALYPLLGCGAAALALAASRRRRAWLAAVAGALASASLFVTFSLVPLMPLLAVLAPLDAWLESKDLRRAAVLAVLFTAGFVAVHALLVVGLGYPVFERWSDAMEFHRNWWKGAGGRNWLIGSPIQFFMWLGAPLSAAFFAQAARSRPATTLGLVTLLAVFLLIFTDVFGYARAESQRLWLFWAPFVCLGAGARLADWETTSPRILVPAVMALEVATAFLIKVQYTF